MASVSMEFDPRKAIQQAAQLEDIAWELRRLAEGDLSDAATAIQSSWDGESASLFLRHCEETRERITARASALDRQAARLREAAGRAAGSGSV